MRAFLKIRIRKQLHGKVGLLDKRWNYEATIYQHKQRVVSFLLNVMIPVGSDYPFHWKGSFLLMCRVTCLAN
jgi:hypothetical protein